jgi:hypothetical protein
MSEQLGGVEVDGRAGRATRIDPLVRDVLEDPLDHPRLGDERDDPHLPAATGADEWVDLVDAADELRPAAAGRPPLEAGPLVLGGWRRQRSPTADGHGRLPRPARPHDAGIAGLDALEERGALAGGMLPKVTAARAALAAGVGRVHVVSLRQKWGLLIEVFTNEGAGTLIVRDIADLAPAEKAPADAAQVAS